MNYLWTPMESFTKRDFYWRCKSRWTFRRIFIAVTTVWRLIRSLSSLKLSCKNPEMSFSPSLSAVEFYEILKTSTIALLVLLKLINCNPMPSINYRISFYWFLKMLNWLALIMLHELYQIPSNAINASGFAIEAAPFMNGFNISWVVSFRKKNHRQIDHMNLLPRKYVFYAIKCILMPKRKIHEKI